MRAPKIHDLIPGEMYAVGLLFNARRVCLVRVDTDPNSSIKSLLARVTGTINNPVIVGFYEEETDSWTPAIIRHSQILGKWSDYVKMRKEMEDILDLQNKFKDIGIIVVNSANGNITMSRSDAEKILNMLKGPGEVVKGTSLRLVK